MIDIKELKKFYAGDILNFYVNLSGKIEDISNTETADVVFAGDSIFKFEASEVDNNKGFIYFNLTEEETTTIEASNYQIFIVLKGENFKKTIKMVTVEVLQNIENMTTFSNVLSYNKRMLIAICDLLEGRMKDDYISYTIGNRSITKMSIENLSSLKDKFQELVDFEESRASGKNKGNKIIVRYMS